MSENGSTFGLVYPRISQKASSVFWISHLLLFWISHHHQDAAWN
jgi:hypothetical protein